MVSCERSKRVGRAAREKMEQTGIGGRRADIGARSVSSGTGGEAEVGAAISEEEDRSGGGCGEGEWMEWEEKRKNGNGEKDQQCQRVVL
jgi:hypothetical protein